MAVSYDAAGRGFSASNVAALSTESMTVAGADRYIQAHIGSGATSAAAPSGAKWGGSGGTAMSILGSSVFWNGNFQHTVYELIAPATGASTGYVTWASNQEETLIIFISATGIDQSTPVRGSIQSDLSSAQNPTHNVTTVSGDLVLSTLMIGDSINHSAVLGSSTGTMPKTIDGADVGGYESLASAYQIAAGTTTTVTFTATDTASANWAHLFSTALIEATGGGGGGGSGMAGFRSLLGVGK